MSGHPFALGWDKDRAVAAQAAMKAGRYCTVNPDAPILPAVSLSEFVLRELEQAHAGTCWVHSAVCLAETLAVAHGYEAFPVCRRLVGYEGKRLEGGGNPTDGGDPHDSMAAMTSERGAGLAHETLLPYTDDSRSLGTKPPQTVYDDAKASHLFAPVDVATDDDAKRLISAKMPVANGMWWPFNFDDGVTFMDYIGRGKYGHSLTEIGYVDAGVFPGIHNAHDWRQLRNWHGKLYPPLPPEYARLVPGYRSDTPTKTSDFWVRGDIYRTIQGYGSFVRVSATDLDGIKRKAVLCTFLDSFPV